MVEAFGNTHFLLICIYYPTYAFKVGEAVRDGKISLGILIALSFGLIFGNMFLYHRHDGYYSFKNAYYYVQGRDIYYYDDYGWSYYDSYDNFSDYADYTYISDEYIESEPYSDFSESFYYDDGWSSSSSSSDYSSYDNDYDWDSGSDWDSGGSDWDSDW